MGEALKTMLRRKAVGARMFGQELEREGHMTERGAMCQKMPGVLYSCIAHSSDPQVKANGHRVQHHVTAKS